MDEAGYFVEVGEALTNKLGISDPQKLEEIEYKITDDELGAALINNHPRVFDFDLLLDLHRQLFQDIYDFAGNLQPLRDLYRQIVFNISDL